MMPGMDGWRALLPAAVLDRLPPAPADEIELGDETGLERQRLIAMRWHLGIGRQRWGRAEPEIYRITAEPLPWQRDDLRWALSRTESEGYDSLHLPAIIARQVPLDWLADSAPALARLLSALIDPWFRPSDEKEALAEHYRQALDRLSGGMPAHLLSPADVFGVTALDQLGDRRADAATITALQFAVTLTKPVPSPTWLRRAAAISTPDSVHELLAVFLKTTDWLYEGHDHLLRGLCWLLSTDPSPEVTALLARVATAAGESTGRASAVRAPRTAAAGAEIAAGRPGPEPVRALARLSLTVRNKTLRTRVMAALDRMAEARGWAPGEALEVAVDDHGLDPSGADELVEIVGEKAKAIGRPAPAEAKALAKEVNKTLGTERARIEGLLAQDRVWSREVWEQRYLRHPVTGSIARRLIWEFAADAEAPEWVAAIPALTDQPGGVVRLWHPVRAGAAEVAAWRDTIVESGLRQPFKQAFREVYRLTPAEEQTRVYSNRFAGHILRYQQAHALMRARGWSAQYLGTWDGGYESDATKEFAAGAWRVSFRHELAGEAREFPVVHCSTDQVRFARRVERRWETASLAEVPELVLSEAMRDVDLFVGVTSIAADETWADRGEEGFRSYWAAASFAPLSGSAEIRRDVLARLLPRLRIGERCELTDRFLRVRGTRAVYRIHLGSANILMEPDDTYLCVVADRRPAGARISLPFDDDERLSLILSKAFLLAADDRITDRSILRQLPR